jgi:aminoglycoside phosphotransferase (APT) family kinase protein
MSIANVSEIRGPQAEASTKTFIETAAPGEVGERLLTYLRERWRLPRLAFATQPETIPHGWETYTFRFQLMPGAGLPKSYARPLFLRVYSSAAGSRCARREHQIEDYLAPLGFPVAKCLLLETNSQVFGGPFLVSEQAPGQPLPDFLYHHAWRIVDLPLRMGKLHAQLHQLPVDSALQKSEPFLDRQLKEMNKLMKKHQLAGLEAGLIWLAEHKPAQEEPSVILHLDFHPLNLLYDTQKGFTVLDWSQIDIGDRHADVAVSKMFMDCMQIERKGLWARFNFWGGRLLLRSGYLAGYRRSLQLRNELLPYYLAWASLRRLCTYGAWLQAGPEAFGTKPASLGNLTQTHVNCFCRYFERYSGIPARLSIDAT